MLGCTLWSRTLEGELGAILFKAAEDILDEWSRGRRGRRFESQQQDEAAKLQFWSNLSSSAIKRGPLGTGRSGKQRDVP